MSIKLLVWRKDGGVDPAAVFCDWCRASSTMLMFGQPPMPPGWAEVPITMPPVDGMPLEVQAHRCPTCCSKLN